MPPCLLNESSIDHLGGGGGGVVRSGKNKCSQSGGQSVFVCMYWTYPHK